MSESPFPDALHLPRAVVAVVVALVVTARFLTAPPSGLAVVVSAAVVVAYFCASALKPVRDHPYFAAGTAATVTVVLAATALSSPNPALFGLLALATALTTVGLFVRTWYDGRSGPE